MRYYISDLHFYHKNLLLYMDKRGFDNVDKMNDYIIDKQNKKVKKNDEVIILGDISLGSVNQTNEILKKLNGTLYLIEGNHDGKLIRSPGFDRSRFAWIKPYAEVSDNGRKVCLSHYPILCYNKQYHVDRNGQFTTWMLHGHIHNTLDQEIVDKTRKLVEGTYKTMSDGNVRSIPFNLVNTFCMYSDYTPCTLDEWIKIDRNRRTQKKNA